MRTDAEILARLDEIQERDFFGAESDDLVVRLPFNLASSFIMDTLKESDWVQLPRDRDSVMKEMLDYMPFAWEKANNYRGLSAARSLSHYTSWVWLCGDDLGDLLHYEFYGKDHLVRICKHYGWDASKWDDGVRLNERE